MTDREKVLELVESIIVHAEDERTNRSWESDDIGWKNIDKIWGCSQQLKELLKKQEAKTPVECEHNGYLNYTCPTCGNHEELLRQWNYCPFCGQKVKWDA